MKQLILFSGVLAGLAIATTPVAAATTDQVTPDQTNTASKTQAQVQIVDDDSAGELTIRSAPNFNFGKVKALEIYNGFHKDSATITDSLKVVDGRSQDIKEGWHLSTKLSAFSSNDKDQLNAATLTLGSTTDAPAGMILNGQLETGKDTTVMSHDTGRGTLELPATAITAKLQQSATPNAAVVKNAAYTADLFWTLTPGIQTKAL
ncbi:WxL domain-containing protein [Lacticaseibacillus sp. GG6-2]